MDIKDLGFYPVLLSPNGKRVVTKVAGGVLEHLRITACLQSHNPCVLSWATTCLKANRRGHESDKDIMKDTWQYLDRPKEDVVL
jgi:hypothetical protein